MVYPPADGHPSKYYAGPVTINFVGATNDVTNHRSIYKYLDIGLPSLNVANGDPFKLTSPAQHLTHARQPNLSSALLVLPAGRMPR